MICREEWFIFWQSRSMYPFLRNINDWGHHQVRHRGLEFKQLISVPR